MVKPRPVYLHPEYLEGSAQGQKWSAVRDLTWIVAVADTGHQLHESGVLGRAIGCGVVQDELAHSEARTGLETKGRP